MTREVTIVVAWVDRTVRPHQGRASTWLLRGTRSDLRKAREYARANSMKVFLFQPDYQFPLEAARKLVMGLPIPAHDPPP